METSPLICRANQWTGFYTIGTLVMKELKSNFKVLTVSQQINLQLSFLIKIILDTSSL